MREHWSRLERNGKLGRAVAWSERMVGEWKKAVGRERREGKGGEGEEKRKKSSKQQQQMG